jgi:hypothetical protein
MAFKLFTKKLISIRRACAVRGIAKAPLGSAATGICDWTLDAGGR